MGRIDLMPGYSLFDVNKADAKRVTDGLTGAEFFGKRVYCEVADADKDYASASRRKERRSSRGSEAEETVADFFKNKQRESVTRRKPSRKRK